MLDVLLEVEQTSAMARHVDYDPAWDGDPDLMVRRVEAWHTARAADDWSFEHPGDRQPGEWKDMSISPEIKE